MASVWVALERGPGGAQRFVALKVMLPKLARLSAFRAMFLDEGQLVRSIEHPGVVRVFEVGEDRGVLFMAMEWVEGDSLHTLIKEARRRRAVPPEMAVRIIADVAGGLHDAHELRGWDGELRGVVHCDVSPHNILIGLDGHAKLTDFGVAHAAALSVVEREGAMMGKVGYMSPEQVFGGTVDRRSDIFSLGVVLFELTTGKRLFGRKDIRETLDLVQRATVPPPTSVWPDYPALLEPIVLRALAREPARRYKTAEEFRRVLEQYLIETRTLVSAAAVGRLLTRVLGTSITARREEVRAALATLHEATPKNAMLLPIPASEPGEEVERSDPRDPALHVTMSGTGVVGEDRPSAEVQTVTLVAPAELGVGTGAGKGRPVKNMWPWAVAGAAVLAAGGAAVVASSAGGAVSQPEASVAVPSRSSTRSAERIPAVTTPGNPQSAAQPDGDSVHQRDEGDAVSVEKIPMAAEPLPRPAVAVGSPPVTPRAGSEPKTTPPTTLPPSVDPGRGQASPPSGEGAPPVATARLPDRGEEDMGFLQGRPTSPPKGPIGEDIGIDNPYQ